MKKTKTLGLLLLILFLTASALKLKAEETKEPVKSETEGQGKVQESAKEPEQSVVPATPKEKTNEMAVPSPVAASIPPKQENLGCVGSLKEILNFYEKQSDNLKKVMARWNGKIGTSLERQAELEKEIASVNKEIQAKQEAGDKKYKKEIVVLKRQLDRLLKSEKDLKKELQTHCKNLLAELGDMGKDSQILLKETFAEVQKNIKDSLKE